MSTNIKIKNTIESTHPISICKKSFFFFWLNINLQEIREWNTPSLYMHKRKLARFRFLSLSTFSASNHSTFSASKIVQPPHFYFLFFENLQSLPLNIKLAYLLIKFKIKKKRKRKKKSYLTQGHSLYQKCKLNWFWTKIQR